MGRLEGKVALITGGGLGIGQAAAVLFAEHGAKVAVCDIKEDSGEKTANLIKTKGMEASFVKADVSDPTEVKQAIEKCLNRYGTLNVLYNCAGIWLVDDAPVTDVSEEVWNSTIAITLTGTFICCKYSIPIMIKNGGGSIINMSSMAGIMANRNHAYSASKGGVLSLTRSIAVSYAPYNIRANALCPGLTETTMTKPVLGNPELLQGWLRKIPLGRLACP